VRSGADSYPLAERAAGLAGGDPDTTLTLLADDLLRYSAGPLKRASTFPLCSATPERDIGAWGT